MTCYSYYPGCPWGLWETRAGEVMGELTRYRGERLELTADWWADWEAP